MGVQLGPVVQMHRLHGAGSVRVSVHGGRDAHPVHPVVGQVFVLHTTNTVHSENMHNNVLNSGYNFAIKPQVRNIFLKKQK